MNNRKGKFKTEKQRDKVINLRLSADELAAIDKLCQQRKAYGAKTWSRTDIICLAVKFASGELSLLDRMEANLLEGKSLFDQANYNTGKWLND